MLIEFRSGDRMLGIKALGIYEKGRGYRDWGVGEGLRTNALPGWRESEGGSRA
jgi:hypothetical protein